MRRGAAVGDGTAKGALLASEMGEGKTPMSIVTANALGGHRPFRTLIIAGQNFRHVWMDHILKWQWPARLIFPVEAGDVHDLSVLTNCWCIINYEILDRFEESIRKKAWDLLIIDESHAAKNALYQSSVSLTRWGFPNQLQNDSRWRTEGRLPWGLPLRCGGTIPAGSFVAWRRE
jgi:hypothetical protein